MESLILVNKECGLDKTYIPDNLILSNSKYKDNILVDKSLLDNFNKMKQDMENEGYFIDIMSGYRDYLYQENIYNKLIAEKGFAYAFRNIAKPGYSEHQTGLAIDICVYKNNKCYIEHDIEDTSEDIWLRNNAYKYGFILRYPKNREDITGYNYEPWHYRYVGIDIAKFMFYNNLTLEEYFFKYCQHN